MAKNEKINIPKLLEDIYRFKSEMNIIKIMLVKNANDPEKIRSLARKIENLL